jgi:DeoR family fructose operon transcriptional repressor
MSDGDRLYAEERRHAIVQSARRAGRVEVAALAHEFGVTPETVRVDLNALQTSGILKRVHGGAIPVERTLFEPQIASRVEFADEKRAIADAALAELPETGAIFLESGSTSMFLAEQLPRGRPLTVFTNSLPIATYLATVPEYTVHTLGGRVRPVTLGEVDTIAIGTLRGVNIDVAFLGTNGLSARFGLTTPDQAEADFKRATLASARRRVLLADRSKIGTVALWRYGDVEDVHVVITSSRADEQELEPLREGTTRLVLV